MGEGEAGCEKVATGFGGAVANLGWCTELGAGLLVIGECTGLAVLHGPPGACSATGGMGGGGIHEPAPEADAGVCGIAGGAIALGGVCCGPGSVEPGTRNTASRTEG